MEPETSSDNYLYTTNLPTDLVPHMHDKDMKIWIWVNCESGEYWTQSVNKILPPIM